MKNRALSTFYVVTACAVLHLLVDALCLCCLYLLVSPVGFEGVLGVFITYNVLAFLTQPLTGAIADRVKHGHWLLLIAVVLLALAVLSTSLVTLYFHPSSIIGWTLTAILLGMGNSLFHVWGGKQVAVQSDNDMRALGIFVSTGAFGLAVSMVFYSWVLLFGLLIALCVLAVPFALRDTVSHVRFPSQKHSLPMSYVILLLLLIMLVVGMRSAVGTLFTGGLERTDIVIIMLGLLTMAGKMAGGWLCQWMGIVRAMAAVVVVVVACLFIDAPFAMLLGLFAINCTMPVTLYFANVLLPGREGLAFGLLAAALVPGYLLAYI